MQSGSTELGIQEGGSNVRSLIVGVSTTDDTPGTQWDSSNSAAVIAFIVNAGGGGGGGTTKANLIKQVSRYHLGVGSLGRIQRRS